MKELKLSGSKSFYADEKSYHALIVTEGETELKTENYFEVIKTGETVFIPASLGKYELLGKATILIVTN